MQRNYSLLGENGRNAIETGLAAAKWYHSDVARKDMKALMKRSDGPALRDTAILYGLMLCFALAGIAFWPSLWSLPFWIAYGVLYGSASDSRWHECGHGTAFRTPWMNDVVYHISSFMMVRNPYTWRWSHARHHTDTYIIGRDPELLMMRPPALVSIFINFFGVIDAYNGWTRMCLHASGKLHPEETCYVPEAEVKKVIHVARIWVVIYAAVGVLALVLWSILPLMVIGLPRLYGAWHHVMTGVLQHGGLAEDVLDHRLNTRTVYMNRISRFIYLDMNHHVEHHMFPMVPYYRLAQLHELIKYDLPAPSPSIYAAFKEMIPVLRRQMTDHDFFLKRELPASARPYREAFHTVLL